MVLRKKEMAANLIPPRPSSNYFSVDDILASQGKIPCTFNMKVEGLGYLDQSTADSDLTEGTKLELPYWLARFLQRGNRDVISVETPKAYKEGYRSVFSADPNVVDLHRLGPFFYLFGGKLLSLQLSDSEEIANVILKVFQGRFRSIMDGSQNALHSDLTSQLKLLDEQEKQLFASGQAGLHDFQRWEKRDSERLSTSQMVANHRKRKKIGQPPASGGQ